MLVGQVEVDVVFERLDRHTSAVKVNLEQLARRRAGRAGHIVYTLLEKRNDVIVECAHVELLKVGIKCDLGPIL